MYSDQLDHESPKKSDKLFLLDAMLDDYPTTLPLPLLQTFAPQPACCRSSDAVLCMKIFNRLDGIQFVDQFFQLFVAGKITIVYLYKRHKLNTQTRATIVIVGNGISKERMTESHHLKPTSIFDVHVNSIFATRSSSSFDLVTLLIHVN